MAELKPGDRVQITTDWYVESNTDYNGGEGTVVRVGCGTQCHCAGIYEVLHDLDAVEGQSWDESDREQWTPYVEEELTKID